MVPNLDNVHQPYGVVVAGVGGTGVITIGQLLGMAAHLDGLGIVTQDSAGLAQRAVQLGAMFYWQNTKITFKPHA